MKIFRLIIILFCSAFIPPVTAETIKPWLNQTAFPGMTIATDNIQLKRYRFMTIDGKKVPFKTCNEALQFNPDRLIEREFFRFRLLQYSCHALTKFSQGTPYRRNIIEASLTVQTALQFPALTLPVISNTGSKQRQGKTIESAFTFSDVTKSDNTIKLLTPHDEFYLTLLARADFNDDGIEDLLLGSQWYARDAFGKHLNLVIVSRPTASQPFTISWQAQP